ncbi:E3 ubiquitin-protein ligase UPL2-like isoform X3 [Camellia sinensis]|uniref:E3 ubiquitin-protein ligase UPL2-like isoform X3 n=1 Tax=Camellia sinensis TaxID=4442 RepID=UPI001036F069|nr:E3 ubiquitin-protein ligase UPL2-like isoform X3 [Camellia sinensis]
MAALRSSLPSRLRQLLSSEGAIGPSVKLDSEPPAKIKAFIDKVNQSPLQDIAIPLSGFRWEYGKGNFHHWRLLFLHFETYFKTHLSCRSDLLLTDNTLEDDCPFPKQAVAQILRVMQIILENCHNKGTFSGLEHFKFILASTDPEILIAALETLSALVKINPSKLHASGKLVGCGSVNSCLLSLAQGWGSKEEGLGLYSCVMVNEKAQEEGLCLFPSEVHNDSDQSQYRLGSTLYFELHGANSQINGDNSDGSKSSSGCVIHIPDLHFRKEDDLLLLKQCVEDYNVPPEHRFSLLTRIRYAHAFRSPRVCRLYSRVCLLAFIVLVQSSDAHDELVSFFANEPEYTNELIRIVRSEETVPRTIRTLAMHALGAQLGAYSSSHERARILSGSSISFAGGNRMILLNVLQRAIFSLKNSNDPSSIAFVEALLQFYLLHVISSSTSGNVVRGSGMVPTFLPLLEDSDPTHLHLVCLAVKTLQKLMDYSNTAVTLFKDLGGVELLTHRLQIEVNRAIDLAGRNDNLMIAGESSRCHDDQLYTQKRLIRVLLKALGSATYAPANSTRSHTSHDASLPATLSLILKNVDKFGGDIYSSAVTVMSEIIHKDPTSFPALHELGLPDAFLASVIAGILPSSKALTCIPNGLGAICLNAKGLEAVKETSALRFLVDVFTSKKYVVAMNEGIVALANAVEELLRHVSSLRSTGVDLIIEIVDRIASIGGNCIGSPGKVDGSSEMEMDSEDKENATPSCLVGATDLTADGVSDEQFIQLCIFHVMVLVHRTMENSETCRIFVEKSGIEALLKLLLRPTIVQSSEGMSIALHSTMVFKGFTQHHSAPLARAFCSSLRDHLKKALTGFSAASGALLLDSRMTPDSEIFSSLFLVEFLLFLAASKDNRWVTALLTEFGNDSKGVLEDIGHVQREVLWQIALLEDAKLEMEDDGAGSAAESRQSESTINETEEQRFNSFRQFLDPLLRRRMSGWSFESQFFDLINLYRDLNRASGLQHRHSIDSPSNLRLGASHQSDQPGSSDAVGTSGRKEDEKQRSYYSSCCDMVKSLSFHITHLFQELGKVMLLPSRRRDDMLNVSPSSKSVASTLATITLDHMNFGGHVNSSGSETSISTKCRYFGKVIDFIDVILLDKPDSCNPILLNCLYGCGVVQSVLTTFEATSQLLFAVNRAPASPMETDDGILKQDVKEETDIAWIYGPLSSYGKLMDHLVTSSLILSPFTKHLLTQPLINGDISFPRDAETFVKILQSMVLKAVLPVWTHSQFTDCSYDFIATVVSIIRHIYSGVEVKNISSTGGARAAGPPPNESTIATIVEMGFSRSRAEEALRQVGSNSVELATDWLFSHPEEAQEDDELTRALAMSLGNSGPDTKEDVADEISQHIEEEMVQPPPVDDLLSTCTKLLQMKESLAFPVRDLLVMICSQNNGQYRSNIISYVIEQVKLCDSDSGNGNMLYALFHVLALIFHEDAVAREVASKTGLVKVASDLLSHWVSTSFDKEKSQVPKWVTAAFLAIDRLSQVDQKLNANIAELLKKDDVGGHQTSLVIDEDKQNKLQSALGLSPKNISIQEQKRLIDIACGCIRNQLPSETMHAVLQLCSTLTKTRSVAVSFLDAGGLPLLLSLPTSSLFVGFDNIAATIIRHMLEDPQTLQLAMESEIRHSVVTAANRQSNGRLTPRNFLLNLTSVISRDPVIFMQAAQSVCQVEMVGERPYIVLLKDRDKDKYKEKEKDKEKAVEKDKAQTADGKVALGNINSSGPVNGHGKLPEINSKNVKVHRKPPQSFVNVIELLLDSVITFVPPLKDDSLPKDTSLPKDMDIDITGNKGKGKSIVSVSEEVEANNQELSASLAKIVFILKLLTEVLLMYSSSIHVLLRRDAEVSSFRGPPQRGPTGHCTGGIFHHILHKFLPYSRSSKKEKKTDIDWKHKLASRASQFLVASCVRSTEGRKRVFVEISNMFNDFVDSSIGFRAPGTDIPALIDLLNDVVAARTPTGSYISAEASATFIDVGLVASLTRTLQVVDLDHAESPKVVTGLVKVLEIVTKEHVHAADSNTGKAENSTKPADQSQRGGADNTGEISQSMETSSQHNQNSVGPDHIESFDTVQTYGGSEAVTDDMEHDQDFDGGFAPAAEDDYMHETPEGTQGLENGLDTVQIRFSIQPRDQENLVDEDDDEEMSADDGDDVDEDEDEDEDDEEHNDLEEDEVHHLPHPDTDQDDHEIDEDEFDEEVVDEDDDDDDEEDGVILRLEEGINGINVFDHIEVFGRDNSFNNETLHVMPVEVFGSRRQGRTTSIYNLLGRTGDNASPSQHPLLVEPSSSLHTAALRQPENTREVGYSDRNLENTSSRLDAIFRSLRNGRHGHRFNMWTDNNQQTGGSNSSAVPQGLEDLIVSHLRWPVPEKPSDKNTTPLGPQSKGEVSQLQESSGMTPETPAENNGNSENNFVPPPSSVAMDSSGNADMRPTENESLLGIDASSAHSQSVEMQFEHNDAAVRDVEAVSQESSGSGATLGESLRSLDVEIGSADGHDDGGERQGSADARTRRVNVPFGNSPPVSVRDAPLHSVTEVSENPSQEADQGGQAEEQQVNGDADSGSIDPAFLDALPEELRAEVLSAQQSQLAQPSNAEPQTAGDIDPEFLAALPPDIREEVLAQQQAQRLHQSQELEGQPVEMDTVSIIATFPSDLREEVLLTSSHDIIANLTPALVAEANMLRERFANRYNRTLFGMYPRNRRGESSRRGEGIGSSLDRAGGMIAHRSMGSKPVEAEGAPLVDTEALRAMVRLLRVVQPLYKGQLQRLLLNLCSHNETRTALVKILMDLLMLDIRKPVNHMIASEPAYRLYACQSHVMYSRPQSFDGVPPLVSRRVLETLTYLARNHPYVTKILLQVKLPQLHLQESENLEKARGKAVMILEEDVIEETYHQERYFSIALLLSLLNQPLYLRSIAHLEQLLSLLEVIIDNAESKSSLPNESGVSPMEQTSGPQISVSNAEINTGSSVISSGSDITSSKPDGSSKPSASSANTKCDTQTVLHNLPQAELRLLCSLLAREGLSDNAYTLAAEVLGKLVAIAPIHCHLLISELADSVQNLTKSAMNELLIFGEAEKALLTTTSSDGAAILRVLQALSSLVAAINEKEKDHQILSEKEYTAAISLVYNISAALEPLWLELSTCISKIESCSDSPPDLANKSVISTVKPSGGMPPLPAGTQNILPYIESFFVMCEKLQPEQSGANQDLGIVAVSDVDDATTSSSQQKIPGSASQSDEKHLAFVKFSEKHRKLLNAFIRQNPGLLEKSFSLMLKVPRFIDFDNKRAHFRSKIKHQHDHHPSPLRISVRRAYILEDSYNQLRMRSSQDLKGRLTVHFQGEEGIDAGGLTREWYQLLSRVIFDKGALLFTTVGNDSTFQPNPNSGYQTEHLSYFKFVGRVVGKALFDGQLLDVHFTRSFYKHILGVKVTYHDIEAIDPHYFRNLKWMLENDISDILDLTFSIDADEEQLILYERTEVTDYELIRGGRNIRVTEENKHKYVDLVAAHRLNTAIRPQINAFLEGFSELIARDLISIFNDKELELLISGLPDIDLDDMRANTEYSGYSAASPVIQWFWEVVQSFSKEDKARLLQFVTGTSKVPLEGFSALQGISGSQKFQIHKAYGSSDHLPSAHTCFNQLDLPDYPSKQHLEERLLLAIHEANEGFGFG